MAPIKHHAPWQCSQVQPNTFNKPSVSLVAPIDNYGHVFVQIEQKQIQALLDTGASISCISQQKQVKPTQQTQNTNVNNQTQEPKPSTSTDTEDQNIPNSGNSKLFPVDEIDRLISSKRGN